MMILAFIFGVVITLFPLCIITHRKDTHPKNNVHFYVAKDMDSSCIWGSQYEILQGGKLAKTAWWWRIESTFINTTFVRKTSKT